MTCRKEGLFIPTAEVKFTWAVMWWFCFLHLFLERGSTLQEG